MPDLPSRRAAGVRQPAAAGFTHWGSFAELVVVDVADVNVVRLPHALDFDTAASLGCRFATAYRAVVHQGRPQPGSWVAVHGCGGVGLSAVMIAVADGAQVVAVDPNGWRAIVRRHWARPSSIRQPATSRPLSGT